MMQTSTGKTFVSVYVHSILTRVSRSSLESSFFDKNTLCGIQISLLQLKTEPTRLQMFARSSQFVILGARELGAPVRASEAPDRFS